MSTLGAGAFVRPGHPRIGDMGSAAESPPRRLE